MVLRNPAIKMSGDRHFTRVNLVEVKILIAKKLGAQKAERYFNLLSRLFTRKLSKSEFDKLCIAVIGRENLCLHNRFIRSIVKNACLSTTAPAKASKHDCSVNGMVANGYQRSCLQSLCRVMFPQSPRRGRTPGFHDRKFRDRPSPLGPHGKSHIAPCGELALKVLEQQSATELHSMGSRPVKINSVEDGEEVDQTAWSPGLHSRSLITVPFGIHIHAKGTPKVLSFLPSSSVSKEICYSAGELPNTSSLRKRLEQELKKQGLKVSLDCANLLNSSLDVYLKRLIKPCLEMAGSRVGNVTNEEERVKVVPGLNGMCPVRYVQRQTRCAFASLVSLVDLQGAMELNPTLLREDWALKLEKVSLQQHLAGGSGN